LATAPLGAFCWRLQVSFVRTYEAVTCVRQALLECKPGGAASSMGSTNKPLLDRTSRQRDRMLLAAKIQVKRLFRHAQPVSRPVATMQAGRKRRCNTRIEGPFAASRCSFPGFLFDATAVLPAW